MKIIAVYCKNFTKHIHVGYGKDTESFNVKVGGIYNYQQASKLKKKERKKDRPVGVRFENNSCLL